MADVLFLDDDYALARGWRKHLRARGHEVVVALTSSEAIAQVEHRMPDVFVVDLILRVEGVKQNDTGQKLLTHMGRKFRYDSFADRVIGISALHNSALDIDFRSIFQVYGIRNFLSKPFAAAELSEMVERIEADTRKGAQAQRPLGA